MAESRARSLANLGNQNALSVDSSSLDVGISSASPDSDLNVGASIKMDGPSGVVTATTFSGSFSGDGSALTGVANTDFIVSVATTAARVVVTGGVNVTGVVTAASFTGDGANLTNVGVDTATVDTGSLNVSGISTLTSAVGFGNSATFDDGASKGVYLGNSHDLQLYHSGNSFIKNVNNSVDLRIISDTVDIKGNSSDEQLAKFTVNGSVDLYYNNVNRLETATHGVNFEHAGTASTSRINPGGSVGVGIGVTTTTGRDAAGVGTVTGQIVFNETTGTAQVYNGTTWDNMSNKFTASGGTEATPGNGYKYHVFTSPGNFVADQTGTIDLLVVAGGGGGGGGSDSTWYPGSGGGAGGIAYGTGKPVSTGTYAVTIGSGGGGGAGAPGSGPGTNGTAGGNSSVGSPGSPVLGQPDYVLGKGGGGGGWGAPPASSATPVASISGGSGGGAPSHDGDGGEGTQPGTNPAFTDYGNDGGDNPSATGGSLGGGGAGGAGPDQSQPASSPSNPGGNGQPFPIFASPLVGPGIPSPLQSAFNTAVGPTGLYGGGGGGGQSNTPEMPGGQAQAGEGGPGGGADGGPPSQNHPDNAVSGTGGGGGGGGTLYGDRGYAGSSGGPGIVIVRYTA